MAPGTECASTEGTANTTDSRHETNITNEKRSRKTSTNSNLPGDPEATSTSNPEEQVQQPPSLSEALEVKLTLSRCRIMTPKESSETKRAQRFNTELASGGT